MPANLVKTAADEKAWGRAKAAAAKSLKKDVDALKDDDYALVNHIFQNMKESAGPPMDFEPVDAALGKKKKCPCGQVDADGRCACDDGAWAFAPLYGDGKGHSGATLPKDNVAQGAAGQSPSPSSPAYPGPGGINAPGVPAGPNPGTGPIVAWKEFSMRGLMEALDFAIGASSSPTVIDVSTEVPGIVADDAEAPPPAPAPARPAILEQPASPTVFSVLIAAVHRAFTQAGDVLFANGYMSQSERIELSGAIGDALRVLDQSMMDRAPSACSTPVDMTVVPLCLEDRA